MRLLRLLHKWFGLIVGLQILLWTVSGLVFAWLDHEDVAAENSLREVPASALDDRAPVTEPAALLGSERGKGLLDATLLPVHDTWVYRLRFTGRVELRRAADGSPFAVTEPLARKLALARYAGSGALVSIALRQPPVLEARGAGAVWEAAFDDCDRTRLYFSGEDGRFVAARNDAWRLFDFFWMLHTMDYRGRDDFNNPLVILFASGALWLGISGVLLLLQSFGLIRQLGSGLVSGVQTRRP